MVGMLMSSMPSTGRVDEVPVERLFLLYAAFLDLNIIGMTGSSMPSTGRVDDFIGLLALFERSHLLYVASLDMAGMVSTGAGASPGSVDEIIGRLDLLAPADRSAFLDVSLDMVCMAESAAARASTGAGASPGSVDEALDLVDLLTPVGWSALLYVAFLVMGIAASGAARALTGTVDFAAGMPKVPRYGFSGDKSFTILFLETPWRRGERPYSRTTVRCCGRPGISIGRRITDVDQRSDVGAITG